jgi:CHC2 zinc finger
MAARTEYHRNGIRNTLRSPINAAKEAVPVIDLADRLCGPGQMRRVGEKWVGRCPLPDHEERTPSFTVYPGDGGWHCFGCSRGGDVVDLAAFAWDHERMDTAAAEVLWTFGHELPQRPPTWFRKQERQRPARDAIDREKIEHIRMLVFRLIWVPWLKNLPPWTRDEAKASAWDSSRDMAKLLYEQRRSA